MPTLQPYKKYNPVAYDYATQLPVGWQLLPNIAIFEERIERGHSKAELLSVTIGRGVIKQTEVEIKKDNSNEDKSKYKLIKIGDIAYNRMRMWQGALGYSDYQGISSPAYVVLKAKMKINPRFFHFMFRTNFYTNYSKRFSYGIVDDQLSLRYTDFKRMYSIVPPIEVQNKIVEYLDAKNESVELFIKEKEKLIEFLQEKKISLQDRLTRIGINKDAPSKNSGNKWIGIVNSGWKVLPNIAIFEERIERGFPNEELLSVTIGKGVIKQSDSEKRDASTLDKSKYLFVHKGDLVYSMRFRQGACGYSSFNGIVSPACTVLKPRKNILMNPKYFFYLFKTGFYKNYVERFAYGIADGQIPLRYTDFKRMSVLIPSLEEQSEIVSLLDSEFMRIDNAIVIAKREIASIKEYREAIITNAVTGKINVTDKQLQMN